LEEDLENRGLEDVAKHIRFLEKIKQHLQKRYVHTLVKRQKQSGGNAEKMHVPNTGAVVLSRRNWYLPQIPYDPILSM